MKDTLVTVELFNDSASAISDVTIELLVVSKGKWSVLGSQVIDRVPGHTQAQQVVGGAMLYDPLPLAKGRVHFTDQRGKRWELWSDGRLLAFPDYS